MTHALTGFFLPSAIVRSTTVPSDTKSMWSRRDCDRLLHRLFCIFSSTRNRANANRANRQKRGQKLAGSAAAWVGYVSQRREKMRIVIILIWLVSGERKIR